jgi:hypothetical protein
MKDRKIRLMNNNKIVPGELYCYTTLENDQDYYVWPIDIQFKFNKTAYFGGFKVSNKTILLALAMHIGISRLNVFLYQNTKVVTNHFYQDQLKKIS